MEINKDPKTWAAFERYCEWVSLPRHFAGYTADQLELKGFSADLIELLSIKYKKDFAVKFCISAEMLTDWDKSPELKDRLKKNWKAWTKKLTPGVMGKFYDMLMKDGDPQRFKLWMEHVEGEKEDNKVNVNIGFENMLKAMREDNELPSIDGKKEDTPNGKETL